MSWKTGKKKDDFSFIISATSNGGGELLRQWQGVQAAEGGNVDYRQQRWTLAPERTPSDLYWQRGGNGRRGKGGVSVIEFGGKGSVCPILLIWELFTNGTRAKLPSVIPNNYLPTEHWSLPAVGNQNNLLTTLTTNLHSAGNYCYFVARLFPLYFFENFIKTSITSFFFIRSRRLTAIITDRLAFSRWMLLVKSQFFVVHIAAVRICTLTLDTNFQWKTS